MIKSESIDQISSALAVAQAAIKNPAFDSVNPHFKNRYASLAAVRNSVIPAFAGNGLSVIHEISSSDRGLLCRTIILHASGQYIYLDPLEMPLSKMDPQSLGSAATYARRYTLMAVGGISGDDDDDDANSAHGEPSAPAPAQIDKPRISKEALDRQFERMRPAIESGNRTAQQGIDALESKYFLTEYDKKRFLDIPINGGKQNAN